MTTPTAVGSSATVLPLACARERNQVPSRLAQMRELSDAALLSASQKATHAELRFAAGTGVVAKDAHGVEAPNRPWPSRGATAVTRTKHGTPTRTALFTGRRTS